MIRTGFAVVLLSCALSAQTPPYLNPDLPAEKRAADLVSRMTLDEKVLQMQNVAPAIPRLDVPAYDWWNEALHGVARAGQATVFPQAIGLAATWDTDLMFRVATVISTEARAKYHEAIRNNDHTRYHGLTFWSPNINIFRDPRWGRGQETYGEDPFLTGRLAVAFIKGMQGDDPHYFKVIATAKHYAVHSGPESSRHRFDVNPSERDLNETYLPAFRASITEGKADSVMCAYNRIDGKPACANPEMLGRLHDWGFQGYVVSDCGAISDIYHGHQFKPNAAEASAVAVKAGTDLTCGDEYQSLVDAVKNGLIIEAEINRSLERLFIARFKLGMFDPPERVPYAKIPYSVVDSPEHRKLALEAARKSIVLLKNESGILPINASVAKIALIGPAVDDSEGLLGNYNGFSRRHVTPLEGIQRQFQGKADVRYELGATYTSQSFSLVPTSVLGSGLTAEYFDNRGFRGEPVVKRIEPRPMPQPGVPDPALSAVPLRGYSVRWTGALHPPFNGDYTLAVRGSGARVFLDDKELTQSDRATLQFGGSYKLRIEWSPQGSVGLRLFWIPPAEPLLAAAVEAVKNSDVAVAFVGLNPNLEGEEMRVNIPGFSGGDRTTLDLPEPQEQLVRAAIATGKPVIVVLASGSALSVTNAAEHAAAVLETWYTGEEAGTAIAETLAGLNNPAGRLPVTFYRSVDQLPPFDDYNMHGRTYRYFRGDPLWGFGYGLSYSKFQYSNLRTARSPNGAQISVRVKNHSTREGDEVSQIYFTGAGRPDDPIRQLRGFRRVHLKPGETRRLLFSIPAADLPKNTVKITVGGGQPTGSTPHLDGVL